MHGFRLRPKGFEESVDNLGIAVGGFGDAVAMLAGGTGFSIASLVDGQMTSSLIAPLAVYEFYLLSDMVVRYATGKGLSERAHDGLKGLASLLRDRAESSAPHARCGDLKYEYDPRTFLLANALERERRRALPEERIVVPEKLSAIPQLNKSS